MFKIILFQPEIPPNTGNIIRLSANCAASLHLIEPFAFDLSSKNLRRAGLDYKSLTNVHVHKSFEDYLDKHKGRIFACSTKGSKIYSDIDYQAGDSFIFGPETKGLPKDMLEHSAMSEIIKIPMAKNNRSINLANAVSIIVFEAWRQIGFTGA